ncbi:oligosaccharide flippase family protein [Proteus faecis]|uniref:oligosaccharide flippase family protein n=2 Tax=Proteus TaxID=583 RepID=UPI0021BB3C52|nr:oligosaccharide flippase family protein [Proteus faecis]MCT8249414.1 oligosaccharide flippase family protein [Proteus faecis]
MYYLKKLIINNLQTVKNITYLSLIQFLTIILPFITYPYFIKTLGFSNYGKVIFYQTIITYISMIINYGFNFSGVRAITTAKTVSEESEIITSIYLIKFIIFLLILIIISLLFFFIKNIDVLLLLASLSLVFNELLFPQWYFQAKEKLKIITILTFAVRFLSLVLMFILITEKNDYYLVPLLNGIGFFIIGVISFFLILKDGTKLKLPNFNLIFNLFKESTHYFLTSLIISIKNKTDLIIIGIFINKEMVVAYDLALKIHNMSLMPINIINNAVFSKMSKQRNKKFLIQLSIFTFLISLIGIALVINILPFIVNILSDGQKSQLVIKLATILILSLPFFSISTTLSQNGIIVFGYSKYNLYGAISTTIIYLLGILLLFILELQNNIYSYAYLTVFIFLYEMSYRLILCKRIGLLNFK